MFRTPRPIELTVSTELLLLIARRGRTGVQGANALVAWSKRAIETPWCPPAAFALSNHVEPYHSGEVFDLYHRMLDELGVPKHFAEDTRTKLEVAIVAQWISDGTLTPFEGLAELVPLTWDVPAQAWECLVDESYAISDAEWTRLADASWEVDGSFSMTVHELEERIRDQAETTLRNQKLEPWAERIHALG